MSRRDTIIIAVLLNAGLLIVLFATSLKSDLTPQEASSLALTPSPSAPLKVEEAPIAAPSIIPTSGAAQLKTPLVSGDEVDQAVKQYAPPLLTTTPDAQLNFTADLQSITGAQQIAPAPEGQQIAESGQPLREVTVKKGDVLERIARHNHVSVDEIMKANGLTSARLKIGQVLKIPGKAALKNDSKNDLKNNEGAPKYYTVKNGDNPWTISVKNHIKVEDLLRLNNLDEEKARRLKPGDKIRIQ